MSASAGSAHSPTLDTIRMVEAFIREHSGEYRRRALWERLPRKVMYQTFKTIIEYLQESNKIAIDAKGKVCWIHDPDLVWWYRGPARICGSDDGRKRSSSNGQTIPAMIAGLGTECNLPRHHRTADPGKG